MAKSPVFEDIKQRHAYGMKNSTAAGRRQRKHKPEVMKGHNVIYGIHAVQAVLSNSNRDVYAVYLTRNAQSRLSKAIDWSKLNLVQIEPKYLDQRLGNDIVHQGAMVECSALIEPRLQDFITAAQTNNVPIVVLDHITDPHNFGAILRSCAVFGCAGVVTTRRRSPPLFGAVAKSASGALEHVPVALVQNLSRELTKLANNGVEIIGLEGTGSRRIESVLLRRPVAIVLGAEGHGLRESTKKACTFIASIYTQGLFSSLNVSNAAAIALHTHAMLHKGVSTTLSVS